ncbi:DUF3500 domain-containing protein [Rhodococcoides fascians]|uniref:DUF3500 domain-containing protein n=1 Tax=Rhodococcoides fascians TaxID=1828 RepID=UPI00192E434C|nr:DUF3500 domain-containing protein [Rhodococcus fascians]
MALSSCSSDTSNSDSSGATPATSTAASTDSSVEAVTTAANAFLDTLDDTQQTEARLEFTEDNATAWSNLPCGADCRVGIEFSTLDEDQLTSAKALLQAAMGTAKGQGYDQAMQILAADDVLGTAQTTRSGSGGEGGGTPPVGGPSVAGTAPSGAPSDAAGVPPGDGESTDGGGGGGGGAYSSGNYYLAILGTPSDDGSWQVHFGGHHLAVNLTYAGGVVAGATPYFIGVEPKTWETDGVTYAPLDAGREAMLAVLSSLDETQLASAKLTESFTDVLLGPDQDGGFPDTKTGVAVSELSEDQKALVLAAMVPWVSVADANTQESLMATYEDELDQTYVSYSGGTALESQGDYVRIDGPSVWIEFVCQNGVVYSDQIHYHTIWRDHTRDYGGEFSF